MLAFLGVFFSIIQKTVKFAFILTEGCYQLSNMGAMMFWLCGLGCLWSLASAELRLSKTLGDGMVLQQAPASATVWGFASAGCVVNTTFAGQTYSTSTDATGVWRQVLPPTPAEKTEKLIVFESVEGNIRLSVLFGEVFLCSVSMCALLCIYARGWSSCFPSPGPEQHGVHTAIHGRHEQHECRNCAS